MGKRSLFVIFCDVDYLAYLLIVWEIVFHINIAYGMYRSCPNISHRSKLELSDIESDVLSNLT